MDPSAGSFDIVYEGTGLRDCLNVRELAPKHRVIVFEPSGRYGSTCQISEAQACSAIEGVLVHRMDKAAEEIHMDTSLSLVRMSDELTQILVSSGGHAFLDFIPIAKMYFVQKGETLQIPASREELAFCKFISPKEKMAIHRAMKSSAPKGEASVIEELMGALSLSTREILLGGLAGCSTVNPVSLDILRRFVENFGGPQYLYPTYNMKDLSEIISRTNAINGVSYLVKPAVGVRGEPREFSTMDELLAIIGDAGNSGGAGPLVHIDSEFGAISGSLFVRRALADRRRHYRVLLASAPLIGDNCTAVYRLEGEYIHSLHVKVCEPKANGTLYMAYFWSDLKPITSKDLSSIGASPATALADVQFASRVESKWYTTDK